jgi:NADH-quinone oxidoreductase subunit J
MAGMMVLLDVMGMAAPAPLPGLAILLLCVVAGVGTYMLLPSGAEAPFRKIGGVLVAAAGLIVAALLVRAADQSAGGGVYFWIFSAIGLTAAVRVVTHPRPVYSALYFVLTVFATAGLFVLEWAQFMAAALVIIYAGAILVTYVFVIMLAAQAQTGGDEKPLAGLAEYDIKSREPLLATAVGFATLAVLLLLIFDTGGHLVSQASSSAPAANAGSTQALGTYIFTNQLVSLELSGLILTISMVGAIMIARRRVASEDGVFEPTVESVSAPGTPDDDNPHSIPVYGTTNPRQKSFPEH